jgi:hypothetical protein
MSVNQDAIVAFAQRVTAANARITASVAAVAAEVAALKAAANAGETLNFADLETATTGVEVAASAAEAVVTPVV